MKWGKSLNLPPRLNYVASTDGEDGEKELIKDYIS